MMMLKRRLLASIFACLCFILIIFFIKKVLKQLIGLLQMDLQLQDRREFR